MKEDSSTEQIILNSEIALNAIEQYSFNSAELKFLKHLENTTFKLSTEQGKNNCTITQSNRLSS
ncbi:MAG: hypothetical protein WBF90_25445 [Rivularia sp. (in: cyanobacteria)]|jgi:hypothetical protein